MKLLKSLVVAAAITLGASASADDAAGPSVGHPLAPLCDLICGGTWDYDTPPYPDEFRTRMTFAWNADTASIMGQSVRSGGIAGIRQVTSVTFAYDADADTITVTRAPDEANWTKIGGELPPAVSGTLTLADTGFQMRFESASTPGEMMITAVRFETPDLWIERSEITGNGQSTLGTEQRYVRKTE